MALDLPGAYQNILALFTTKNYAALTAPTTMDANIIVKRVLHPDSIIGLNAVAQYLVTMMLPQNPTLTNISNILYYQVDPTYGHASGDGIYYDNSVPGGQPFPVHFIWCFTRADATKDWLLVNVFGHRTG